MLESGFCVLCKARLDYDSPSCQYLDHRSAHVSCIEGKVCVLCGYSGLCQRCESKDCLRTYHLHCFERFFPHNGQMTFCDIHRKGKGKGKRKEYQRLALCRQVAGKINEETDLIKKIKEKYNDSKFHSICSGQVFWFFIGTQYFISWVKVQKPEIPVKSPVEHSERWEADSIQSQISCLESSLSEVSKSNKALLESIQTTNEIDYKVFKDLKEEELILLQVKNIFLKDNFEEYLRYFESKVKQDTDTSSSNEKRTSSLFKVPKNEEDFVCAICCDGDYEDDDLIVICSICEQGAHMKCYGIPVVPEGDWVCHGCKAFPVKETRANIRCALCPVKGGCIKPTVNRTTGTVSFPNYPEGLNEQVWCHVFCAFHLEPKVFKDKEFLDSIDLAVIDSKRFSLKCGVCKSKDGACLQCQYGRCQTAFHPECGKEYFTNTRDKTGYDEVGYYCPIHKPLKLRRVLEGKDKKAVEDVVAFSRHLEKLEKKAKNPASPVAPKKVTRADRPFSYEEKFKLIEIVENELEKLRKASPKEFAVFFRSKAGSLRNRVDVARPEQFNIIDPQAILSQKIAIKGRKPTECFKFYQDFIYPVLKLELELQRVPVVCYYSKGKKPSSKKKEKKLKKKTKAAKREKIEEEIAANSVYSQEVFADIVSEEVYCICRKPFVEKSVKRLWESEQDFAIRTEESKMILCDNCEEWYHYKCIGVTCDNLPEVYICEKCRSKSSVESN